MEKILWIAEMVYDGWYSDSRIDWDDFLYRVESMADADLGNDMLSPEIKRIKSHIRSYRNQ